MPASISKQDYIKPFQLLKSKAFWRNFNNELYEKLLNKVTPIKSGVVIPKVELRTIMPNDLNRSLQLAKVTFAINDDAKKPTIENLQNIIRGHKASYTKLKNNKLTHQSWAGYL